MQIKPNQTGNDNAIGQGKGTDDSVFVTPSDFNQNDIIPFGTIGEIVDVRTYRRWIPELKRRETAYERWARVINYNLNLVRDLQSPEELREEGLLMVRKFSKLLADASGRTKWVGGTTIADKHAASQFNCSGLAVNRLEAFSDAFQLLMLGTGVGYRVFSKDINQLPAIVNPDIDIEFVPYVALSKNKRLEETCYVAGHDLFVLVGDSRQGWVDALMTYLKAITNPVFPHPKIIYEFSSVRPEGERLSGFGGTASGPFALQTMISDVQRIIAEIPGDRFRSIDCLDIMCAIAKGVVAGSARRSAMICLFEQGDDLCANAKKGLYTNPELEYKRYRSQSNNTECMTHKPSLEEIKERLETCKTEGEPGFNNYSEMIRRRRVAAENYRVGESIDKYTDVVTNPCFAAGTMVLTRDGHYPIEELVGKVVEIWDGDQWVQIDNFRVTAKDVPVFKLSYTIGETYYDVYSTRYHKYVLEDGTTVQMKDLKVDDVLHTMDGKQNAFVHSISFSHQAEKVYCCTVPTNHRFTLSSGLIVGQCHEIILSAGLDGKAGSFCNLTTLPLPNFIQDGKLNLTELESSIRLNTRISLRQTCVDIPMQGWDETQKEERLLGVSVTGWQDAFALLGWKTGDEEIQTLLAYMREWANDEATKYSEKLNLPRPLLVTCIKPEGCLDSGALRVTDQGILSIYDINPYIDDELGFSDVDGFSRDGDSIPRTFNNGVNHVQVITLQNGRRLMSSPNHQFSVNGEWVRSDQLKPGLSKLDYQLGTYSKKTNVVLAFPSTKAMDLNTTVYEVPESVNPDLAWLLGQYWANGCFTTNDRIKLHCQHLAVHEKVQLIWKEQFGVITTIQRSSDRDSYTQDFRSTYLTQWFKLNGFLKIPSEKILSIPVKIRQSSVESVIAFIAGYADGDGCFHSDSFCIDSNSEVFIRHLQQVGEAVGFCFSCIENSQRTGRSEGSIWKCHLSKTYSLGWAIDLLNKHSVKAAKKPVKTSNYKNKTPYPYTVVSNIVSTQPINTYDIEVSETHSYYTGGILSHNTASQIFGVSNGLHWDWSPYYIRRVRMTAKDALAQTLIDQGFPCYPELYDLHKVRKHTQYSEADWHQLDDWQKLKEFDGLMNFEKRHLLNNSNTVVFEFPVKSYSDRTQSEVSAIEQLENLKAFTLYYCDHMPSVTITVKDHEWNAVAEWIDANWDNFITASFFPYYDAKYPLLPYEAIDSDEYDRRMAAIPTQWKATLSNGRNRFVIDEVLLNKNEWQLDEVKDDEPLSDCSSGACPVR